jgi:uncharacterized repeat protein (TIGR02059 family)
VVVSFVPDTVAPSTSISISSGFLTSGTSVSGTLNTNENLSSVTLYYSTSSSLSSPQSCGSTSNPTNGQSLTCTISAVDATYYFYTRGTDIAGNIEAAPGSADDSLTRDTVSPTPTFTTPVSPSTTRTLIYTLAFSETVTGIATADFTTLNSQGMATCSSFNPSASSGTSITVTVTCTTDGSVTLRLAQGGVADSAGNTNTSAVDASSVIVDTTPPTLSSASVASNGLSLTLTYNETLSATTAAKEQFTVLRTRLGWVNAETPSVSSVAVSGSSVTLSLGGSIFSGDAVTVSYVDPSGSDDASAVQDSAGNDAASLTNQAVTNNSTVKRSQTALSINQSTLTYGETVTLTTSGGLGTGAVTYDENSAACSISGTTLTGVAAGDCIVTATKATDDVFLETTTTKTITIIKAQPFLSSFTLPAKTYGDTPFTVTDPSVTGSIPGSFSYLSDSASVAAILGNTVTITGAGSATLTALFTPTDTDNYETSTITALLTVAKASQSSLTITSTTIPYGQSLSLTTSGGSGTGALTFVVNSGNCSITTATLTSTSTGSCSVTATKASDSNYLAESTTATITITTGSATATIAFSSTTLTFGVANPITVTVSTAGSVRFSANGRVIKNCKSISTITSGSITATCSYRPATRRPLTIRARLTPTDTNIAPRTSTSAQFLVQRRTGVRG